MAPCNACNRDLRHEHDGICVYVCIPRGSPVRSVKKYQQLCSNVQLPRFRFDGLAKNNLSRQSISNKSRLSRRIILDRVVSNSRFLFGRKNVYISEIRILIQDIRAIWI